MHPHHKKHGAKKHTHPPKIEYLQMKKCDSNDLAVILAMVFGILVFLLIISILAYICYLRGKRRSKDELMKEVAASPTDVELSTGLMHEHTQKYQSVPERNVPRIFVHADSKDEEGKQLFDNMSFESSSSSEE